MAEDKIINLHGGHNLSDMLAADRRFAEAPVDQAARGCVMALQETLMDKKTQLKGVIIIVMDENADRSMITFTPSVYLDRNTLAYAIGHLDMAKDLIKDEAEEQLIEEIAEGEFEE